MNRWNYSVLVATLLAIGGVMTWTSSHPSFLLTGACGALILSGIAALMCILWIRQIDDFKALNTVKFQIINEMAPLVKFDDSTPGAKSFECFQKEWEELTRLQALQRVNSSRLSPVRGLRSTSAEYFVPRALMALFALILAGVCTFMAVSWKDISAHPSPFSITTKVGAKP